MRNFVFFSVLLLFALGCNEIRDCQLDDNVDFFSVEFFDRDTTSLNEDVIIRQIVASGFPGTLVADDTLISIDTLYINAFDSVTSYYFQTEFGFDTMVVSYQTEFFIFFEDCPPGQRFFDFKVLSHTFDSLAVVDTVLTLNMMENVQIFLD